MTIILDDALVKKLRMEQAKLIQKSTSSVSFSQVLSYYLQQGLKNGKKRAK